MEDLKKKTHTHTHTPLSVVFADANHRIQLNNLDFKGVIDNIQPLNVPFRLPRSAAFML